MCIFQNNWLEVISLELGNVAVSNCPVSLLLRSGLVHCVVFNAVGVRCAGSRAGKAAGRQGGSGSSPPPTPLTRAITAPSDTSDTSNTSDTNSVTPLHLNSLYPGVEAAVILTKPGRPPPPPHYCLLPRPLKSNFTLPFLWFVSC